MSQSAHKPNGKEHGSQTLRSVVTHNWKLQGVSRNVAGRVYPLLGKVVVGRSVEASIVLEEGQISRRHALLEVRDGCLYVEDLGSTNGTFINGNLVSQGLAHPNDEVRFDILTFKVIGPEKTSPKPKVEAQGEKETPQQEKPWSQERSAGPNETVFVKANKPADSPAHRPRVDVPADLSSPALIGLTGQYAKRILKLQPGKSTIGREPTSDVVINDPTVSARHAQIVNNEGKWKVINLISSNGTYVNGTGEQIVTTLKPGDIIRFGQVEFQFELGAQQASYADINDASGKSIPLWVYVVGALVLIGSGAVLFFIP